MADRNRYRGQGSRGDYNRSYDRDRQPEQFQSDRSYYGEEQSRGYGQMGEDYSQDRFGGQSGESGYRDERYGSSWRDERGGGGRSRGYEGGGGERNQDYESEYGGYPGRGQVNDGSRSGFNSFNSEDFRTAGSVGPREHLPYGYGRTPGVGGGAYSGGSYGPGTYGVAPRREYGSRGENERGFFAKAGDEVASWFGDDEAARRREMDHRGRGPANYTRSDDRVLEDACDALTEDWGVDARNIQVTVLNGEVTLDGTVENRSQKRRAEDVVHDLSGVKHVQNNLRTSGTGTGDSTTSQRTTGTLP